MLKLYLIIIFFVLTFNSNAEIKEKIIQNLKNTKNLDFKFEQNVAENHEFRYDFHDFGIKISL